MKTKILVMLAIVISSLWISNVVYALEFDSYGEMRGVAERLVQSLISFDDTREMKLCHQNEIGFSSIYVNMSIVMEDGSIAQEYSFVFGDSVSQHELNNLYAESQIINLQQLPDFVGVHEYVTWVNGRPLPTGMTFEVRTTNPTALGSGFVPRRSYSWITGPVYNLVFSGWIPRIF